MFVTDGDGVVVAKLLHDPYKKRDSAEVIIDAALGRFKLQKTRRLYRWLLTMEEWSAPPLMAVLEACHSESSAMRWCRIARGAAYLWGTRPGRHGPDHYTGERAARTGGGSVDPDANRAAQVRHTASHHLTGGCRLEFVSSDRGQRLVQVSDDVINMLDADRQADIAVGDTGRQLFLGRKLRMCRRRRVDC